MTLNENPTSPVALADAPLDAPLDDDDPRTAFAHAVALATAVIGRVGPSQLANPTPCTDFDVRGLLDHLVLVLRRVAAIGRGDDPFGPPVFASVEGDGWQGAWLAAGRDVQDAWADDAALRRIVRLPWSQDTGARTLVAYLNEVTVHTWDLATATGQRPAWDPKVVGLAFEVIRFLPAPGAGGHLRRGQGHHAARAAELRRPLRRRRPGPRRRPAHRPPGGVERPAAVVVSAPCRS
jgi:uncharacterized protein (TIGR03086 family)